MVYKYLVVIDLFTKKYMATPPQPLAYNPQLVATVPQPQNRLLKLPEQLLNRW